MDCPNCDLKKSSVVDTRYSGSKAGIRRRRKCSHCGCLFTTYELRSDRVEFDETGIG